MPLEDYLAKTLQELDGRDWGEPDFHSHVVTNGHRLRRVPLSEFTVEDVRFMLGQQIGLPWLVPVALGYLHSNPLAGGDHYEGDLLAAALRVDSRFWMENADLYGAIADIAAQALGLLPGLEEGDRRIAEEELTAALGMFQRAEYFARHGRA